MPRLRLHDDRIAGLVMTENLAGRGESSGARRRVRNIHEMHQPAGIPCGDSIRRIGEVRGELNIIFRIHCADRRKRIPVLRGAGVELVGDPGEFSLRKRLIRLEPFFRELQMVERVGIAAVEQVHVQIGAQRERVDIALLEHLLQIIRNTSVVGGELRLDDIFPEIAVHDGPEAFEILPDHRRTEDAEALFVIRDLRMLLEEIAPHRDEFQSLASARAGRRRHPALFQIHIRLEPVVAREDRFVEKLEGDEVRVFVEAFPSAGALPEKQRVQIGFLTADRIGIPDHRIAGIVVGKSERLLCVDEPVSVVFLLIDLIVDGVPPDRRRKHQIDAVLFALVDQIVENAHVLVFDDVAFPVGDLAVIQMDADEIHVHQLEMADILVDRGKMILAEFLDVVEIAVERRVVVHAPEFDLFPLGIINDAVADCERSGISFHGILPVFHFHHTAARSAELGADHGVEFLEQSVVHRIAHIARMAAVCAFYESAPLQDLLFKMNDHFDVLTDVIQQCIQLVMSAPGKLHVSAEERVPDFPVDIRHRGSRHHAGSASAESFDHLESRVSDEDGAVLRKQAHQT